MGEETDAALRAACAAEAQRIAPDLCPTDEATGESCAWYHGFWPTLRILDLVTTPDTHRAFYTQTLSDLIRNGHRRVLISGSADINMLQQAWRAGDLAGAAPDVTFVDRCPTPAALARWAAARTGRCVTAETGDMLAYRGSGYDIVCTHSFLGYFTDSQRDGLARNWAALLRPGGKLVTINRVRKDAPEEIGFTSRQARIFVDRAISAARARGLDSAAISVAASAYAERFRIRPVRSVAVLEALLTGNGFSIDRLEGQPPEGGLDAETGPTTPGGAHYVFIVATRD